MFDWLLRRLPKRVLQLNDGYYPQVWFLWWHYVWQSYYDLHTPVVFRMPDDAIYFIKHQWNRKPTSTKKVVWTGK